MRNLTVFSIMMISVLVSRGQGSASDSLHHLPEFEIFTTRMQFYNTGSRTESIDTIFMKMRPATSVAGLLEEQSSAVIRSYGTGGLATLSTRGTMTTHSGIFWNGFNLNQSNVGMTDLSLLPSLFFNSVDLQYGGGSAVAGSGIIGGSLRLGNTPAFDSPLRAELSFILGSTGEFSGTTRASAGNSKMSWTGAMVNALDRNRFAYNDLLGNRQILTHAANSTQGVMNQMALKVSRRSILSAGIWLQQSYREIPATLVMASSDQEQTDKALRTTLHYSIYTPKQRFQVRSAYFSEYLHFTSPDAHIDAEYRLNTFAMESDYQRQAGSLNFILGFHSRVNMADVPFYKRKEKQADAGLYLSVLNYWKKPGWKTALNLRQDLAEGYLVPFCPSLGAEGRITKTLSARLTLSRNFRIPTMNDRFWQPGGNPVLEPESSWNQEAGVTWTPFLKNKPFLLEHSLTVYNIMIDNLIQWVSKGSYWSPENVDKVWSRGVEAESRIHLSTSIGRATMKVRYAFAPSGKMDEKGKATKQLIYIPKHRATFSGTWQLKTYYGSVTCTYNGERFVNPENTLSMPRYVLVNLTLGREFRLRQSLLRLQLDARNVLDTEYQVVKYFPEPGFTVLMNLVISI